jgi:ribosomal protein S18 acetylase RimI-like enzyme
MQLIHERFIMRPLTEAELDDMLEVYRQCEDFLALGPVPVASMDMVRADWQLSQGQGGEFCGIYDPGGVLVGVLDVIPSGFEGESDVAFLELLMIAAPYRSSGLGTAVVRALEDDLVRRYPVRLVRAGVQANNPGAIRFWQRQGFVITGEAALIDGTSAFPLCKVLKAKG